MKQVKTTFSLLCLFGLFSLSSASLGSIEPTEKLWRFKVFLDESPIGYHEFSLKQQSGIQTLNIKAEFDVKFLFINVYSYRHANIETWNGDCLATLSSNTDDNGDAVFVRINKRNDDHIIETPSGSTIVNTCLRSFAYWNPDLLNSRQLVNAQNGDLIDVDFIRIGTEPFTFNDTSMLSDRYRLQGKDLEIDLWYSADKEWLGLQSTTENGSKLRYVLQQRAAQ